MKRFGFWIACSIFSMAPALHATALTVNNPGFEADVLGNGGIGYSVVGWTPNLGCCGIGIYDPTTGSYASGTSIEGNNLAYGNGGGFGYYQALSNTFSPNTTYTFSMMVGHRLDTSFGGYTLQLRAGTSYAATALATLTGTIDPGFGQWGLRSLVYTTGATGAELGQSILISFGSNGIQTNFDLATVDARDANPAGVPEPATFGLLGLSLCSVTFLQARRRRRSA